MVIPISTQIVPDILALFIIFASRSRISILAPALFILTHLSFIFFCLFGQNFTVHISEKLIHFLYRRIIIL